MNCRTLFCGIGILLIQGCALARKDHFDVAVRNVGGVELDRVVVEFEGFFDQPGVLPAGVHKSFDDYIGRFPKEAKLTWRLSGSEYMPDVSTVVPVPLERPPLERGKAQRYELLFELNGETAMARYLVNDYTWINEVKKTEGWH